MPILLALDQGTTSSRAILFSDAGDKIAVAQREFTQHYPQPGWVEHDPQEIWSTQIGVATEVMGIANVRPRDIAAIGITNQRETAIVWNRDTGKPIHRAIVWQDRRTSGMIDRLRADGLEETIIAKTGLVPDAYFSASKVAWILDNVDGARDLAERGKLAFGNVDSWLVYQLTDHALHVTDVTNASRTMLFNIHTMDWDDDLLAHFSIPRSMLPEVKPSCGIVGNVSSALALSGVPIAGIAGDQQSALMGQLCTEPGMVKNTYGTGCFMLMNAGDSPATSKNRLLSIVACSLPGQSQFALEGSVYIGGAVVQWLRDGLKIIRRADEVEKLARSVEDNGGVQFVPAFAGLGAPHWDQDARGIICGLTRGVTDGHIARAAIESIAHQVADLFEAMRADCGASIPHLRVDGGAANNELLLQFQADLLQTPILLPQETETTALGVVYLAGLATGVWEGLDALASHWKVKREFEPTMSRDETQIHRAAWQRAVERARHS